MNAKLIQSVITVFVTCTLLTSCATKVGNATFHEASPTFVPKQVYSVAYDKLWDAVVGALDNNRIATASMDKASGIVQTDYLEGQSSLIAFGLIASQSTRYKYNVALRNQADGKVRLNILCRAESTMLGRAGSSQWTDVTSQNEALVKKLETWLYEEIEKGL